jgi:hypothetical protein
VPFARKATKNLQNLEHYFYKKDKKMPTIAIGKSKTLTKRAMTRRYSIFPLQ